jgi:hypothetical protein
MGPIGYPETSVANYLSTPHKTAAERRSHFLKTSCCVLCIFVKLVSNLLLLTEMGAVWVK